MSQLNVDLDANCRISQRIYYAKMETFVGKDLNKTNRKTLKLFCAIISLNEIRLIFEKSSVRQLDIIS